MKSTLNKFLLALVATVLGGLPVRANYDGGQILNTNDSVPGSPLYTGDITIKHNEEAEYATAGVSRIGAAGSNGSTTLEGNISISAGYDYRDSDEVRRNVGVYVGYEDHLERTGLATDATITLKTEGAGDRITIDAYSKNGIGVMVFGEGNRVVLDSSASGEAIVVRQHSTGGNGMSAQLGGVISVTGDLDMTVNTTTGGAALFVSETEISDYRGYDNITVSGKLTARSGLYGVHARGYSAISIFGGADIESANVSVWAAGQGVVKFANGLHLQSGSSVAAILAEGDGNVSAVNNIEVAGSMNIKATSASAAGVLAQDGSKVLLSGTVDIEAAKHGINSVRGASIAVEGSAGIIVSGEYMYSSAGICANGGDVKLSGIHKIENRNTDLALYALAGGTISSLNGEYASYSFGGILRSEGGGSLIDLKMGDASFYTGSTVFAEGEIHLDLQGNSAWLVTGNSSLTTLALDGSSLLSFALLDTDAMSFANINAAAVILESGAVLQLLGVKSTDFDGLSRSSGDFTASLFTAGSLTANGVQLVTEDKYILEYTNNGDGSFTVTGVTDIQIPEPAAGVLGMMGLASLMVRRRRG